MDLEKVQKRKSFIINTLYLALLLLLGYLFLEHVIGWIMPFLLGFLISLIFRPLIRLVAEKTKISKRICAFVLVLLGYALIGFLVWLLGNSLFEDIKAFCLNLPTLYSQEIVPFIETANHGLLEFASRFSPDFASQISKTLTEILQGLQTSLVDISTSVLSFLAGASTKLPLFLISFIFTILSSLFISMDYDHVLSFLKRQVPQKYKSTLLDIRSYLGKTIVGYLRAYLIIMCITFIELSVGFFALRIKSAFLLAGITAVADLLPVVGTGTILLPWAVISLFQQRFYLALGLLLLYLIVTAVRQFVEPKIVGDQLGIPPILAIMSIYLGYVWFGFLGVILFPISLNILLSLHKADKIHIWK